MLERIKFKTGSETFVNNKIQIDYNVLDFWQWSASDLLSNGTRGVLAEFIVAKALDIDFSIPRDEWKAYDLLTPDNIRVEVKSSAFIQSWFQKQHSKIIFSIKASRYWDKETNQFSDVVKRQSDVYVFCHLKHKERLTINPLDLNQWDFYVVSTIKLDNYTRSKVSITISSLNKITTPVRFERLKEEVKNAYLLK